jgi:tryptophanyl-tRNA synthetase
MMRVFSGIQPTGTLHVGNYSGALRQFVRLQHEAECVFCVVDLHALTLPHDPSRLAHDSRSVAALYLACGIDPERAVLFIQSHVPAHSELAWLLNCTAQTGELGRMTQYKDKGRGRQSVSVGLFDYPVLMAADILLYGTTHVPVGDDQRQHVELTRDLAERFNRRYGEVFVVPQAMIPPVGARIMALDNPAAKMSKSADSDAGRIALLDPPDRIRQKVMRAVTDSGTEVRYDPAEKPAVSSLLALFAALSDEPVEAIAARYRTAGYGAFKRALAEAAVERLAPIRERHDALMADPAGLDRILRRGAERAEALALPRLRAARDRLGLMPRPAATAERLAAAQSGEAAPSAAAQGAAARRT